MEKPIKAMCAKNGWKFSWMDEERSRQAKEDKNKMAAATWEERLQILERSGAKIEVPEGCCKVGCGRKVNPGKTRAGRPFTTCCKGCIMGFGHDSHCGNIDESKVGPGLCKNGCGRAVASGNDSRGRPLDTCCRGCALGSVHDPHCGRVNNDRTKVPAADMCVKGCGRLIAPGQQRNGKPWTTCCRGCATGQDHSPECRAVLAPPAGLGRSGSSLDFTETVSAKPEDLSPAGGDSSPTTTIGTTFKPSVEESTAPAASGCACTIV